MSFEPQKFFIGLIDFFSILVPGALFTFLFKDELGSRLLGERYYQLANGESELVFLFCSYLLGHFIFLIGSWLLDDWYEAIRNATYEGQIKQLSKGKKLSCSLNKLMAALFIKKNADQAVNHAERVKDYYFDRLKAISAINAFQWSKALLMFEQHEALATVQRFEADSKFFRSLVVVLCILIPWGLVKGQPTLTIASLLLIVLAFWRYVDQRVKSTNQAYWYILTLEVGKDGSSRPPDPTSGKEQSRSGGVVFKREGEEVNYLLVQAKNEPETWVLPKGHIEAGETKQETAVREVLEETGIWARIKDKLPAVTYVEAGESQPITVYYYLMEALGSRKPSEQREHVWLPLVQAMKKTPHKESREMLAVANRVLMSQGEREHSSKA